MRGLTRPGPKARRIFALQLRLGAMIVPDSFTCPECGECVDCQLSHASCCAKAERTKGHYAVTKACFERYSYADPTSSIETTGLSLREPTARPADIFTGAACAGRETAIDVTVVSTEAGDPDAGDDHLNAAFRRKAQRYAEIIEEWGDTGPRFLPMVWGHEGRTHPEVARAMEYCATQIARKSGAPAKRILKRWRGEIGTILAVRRARMARRILPKPSDKECFLDGTAEEVAPSKGFNAYVEEKEQPVEDAPESEEGQGSQDTVDEQASTEKLKEFLAQAFIRADAVRSSPAGRSDRSSLKIHFAEGKKSQKDRKRLPGNS